MSDRAPGSSRRAFLRTTAGLAVGAPLAAAMAPTAHAAPEHQAGSVVLRDDFGSIAGWERQGVVIGQTLSWETTLLQDPCLVYATGGGPLFKLWYGSLYYVGYATSDDGITWTKAADPVLSRTLPSESANLNQPSVVFHNGTWHMTYFGIDATGNGQIHYATASAPGGPWTKHGVVLNSTMPWEDRYTYNSALMFDADAALWKLWYTAGKIASAGGEPEYICYATATDPGGPWTKYAGNPIIRPMRDGGWASLGVGGPNVRKVPGGYEMRVCCWQDSYPSRGGRLHSPDGIHWDLRRASMELDLGVAGGPEDAMIYRQFTVVHDGTEYVYYNAKNNRPGGWFETINLSIWRNSTAIVDPAKWSMTQAWFTPNGTSYQVRDNQATSLGNAPAGQPQTLQGNVPIPSLNYALSADVTPLSSAQSDRDSVLMVRCTDRGNYYYAGVASWGQQYAIGVLADGVNTQLAGTGSAADIAPGVTHHLTFSVSGSQLSLYDGGTLVLSVVDPTLIPDTSYVGMQSSTGTGLVSFGNVSVTTLPQAHVRQ